MTIVASPAFTERATPREMPDLEEFVAPAFWFAGQACACRLPASQSSALRFEFGGRRPVKLLTRAAAYGGSRET